MEPQGKQGKSQRKRLQRQLEFYLSESNLRQDKFLKQAMDEQGFVPVGVFLSFNKLKILKATERMILDEAEKSATIRVDRSRSCIAPKIVPAPGQDYEADVRTIYMDSFGTDDDHDSLRKSFSKFGKVNLVSLPRFPQNKKFKGFGFVEFSEQSAAVEAVAMASSDATLRGIRVMTKTRWLEMKEQLKFRLSSTDAHVNDQASSDNVQHEANRIDLVNDEGVEKKQKKKHRKPAASGHIHFGDDDVEEGDQQLSKKQKV